MRKRHIYKRVLAAALSVCLLAGTVILPKTEAADAKEPVKVEMELAENLTLSDAFTASDHNPSGGQHVVINDSVAESGFSFQLSAEKAGDYKFNFRYIAGDKGQTGKNDPRQIRFTVNGKDVGVQQFPSQISWEEWMDKTVVLPLEKGENTIGMASNGTTGNGICVDYFTYEEADDEQIPEGASVYQAEDADLANGIGVESEHAGYTGKGYAAGFDFNGKGRLTFHLNVQTDGNFKIAVRYAAGSEAGWPDDRTLGMSVNDENKGNVTFPSTGSWVNWDEVVLDVNLKKGKNTLSLSNLTENDNSDTINVDCISLWKEVSNPKLTGIYFEEESYTIGGIGEAVKPQVFGLYDDETRKYMTEQCKFTLSDESVAEISGNSVVGKKDGIAVLTAVMGEYKAVTNICVGLSADINFDQEIKEYDPSMFGYILTPNYDIADSRIRLLGPMLNRDSIPAQNFQAISDGNPEQYQYEDSILQRAYEGYTRSQDLDTQFYFLLGHLPSWVKGEDGGIDWGGIPQGPWSGSPDNLAWFKQYIKDVLQYFKDHDAEFKFADLINENWTGWDDTYIALWQALREVYPEEVPAVGPGEINFTDRPDLMIPNMSANKVTLEGPSWHGYWGAKETIPLRVMKGWVEQVKDLQKQYPETNGQYIIFEENNTNVDDQSIWARDMINTIRSGMTHTVKGCYDQDGWNGMSNILMADKSRQNTGYRTEQWWLYYAYSLMSGMVVESTTTDEENGFAAVGYKDSEESKVMVTTPFTAGQYTIHVNMKNQPYAGQNVVVDAYKIVNSENNGLAYQKSYSFNNSEKDLDVVLSDLRENETWVLILKKEESAPGFVHPMTPDDGEAVVAKPTFTWSESHGADSYKIIVSENENMENPVLVKDGIKDTSYTMEKELKKGTRYYWTVVASNKYGETAVIHDVAYSFLVSESEKVPGQFGPYMPSMYAPGESVSPEFKWSTAYNADSYRLVVSEKEDLSNPVIDKSGITNVRWTEQFGDNSQAYYTPDTALKYDTTYYWKVYASNAAGERPMNGPVHCFTTKAEGDKPLEFELKGPENSAKDVSTRTVLDWEASKNAFFYELKISENKDMSNPVLVRDRMIYNRYTMEPNLLKPDTTYYWTVTARTKDLAYETETVSGVKTFTTEAVPSSPLLYAQHVDGKDVTLWFQESNTASSYKIVYGTKPGHYTDEIKNVKSSPYTVKDMKDGNYYFAVIAQNESGDSTVWNEREVTVGNPSGNTDPTPTPVELPYVDVEKDAWYYDAVAYNYEKKTMTGLDKTHFGPADTLVRAQFAAVLHKMNKEVEMEYTDIFPDVTEPDWFKNAVLWAADKKIVTGYTGTKMFGPNDPVTRSQMAAMMYRYAKDYKGYDVKADGDYSAFPDAGDVQEFAVDAMKWAVSEEIIKGKTIDGKLFLDPQGSANRAECATIIQRFMEKYEK